jgi:hypothetical protein
LSTVFRILEDVKKEAIRECSREPYIID